MNETKEEKLLAGSTADLQASQNSQEPLKDGQEPDAILLALLRSPFLTLQARGLAELGSANRTTDGAQTLIIIIPNAIDGENGWEFVGNEK